MKFCIIASTLLALSVAAQDATVTVTRSTTSVSTSTSNSEQVSLSYFTTFPLISCLYFLEQVAWGQPHQASPHPVLPHPVLPHPVLQAPLPASQVRPTETMLTG